MLALELVYSCHELKHRQLARALLGAAQSCKVIQQSKAADLDRRQADSAQPASMAQQARETQVSAYASRIVWRQLHLLLGQHVVRTPRYRWTECTGQLSMANSNHGSCSAC